MVFSRTVCQLQGPPNEKEQYCGLKHRYHAYDHRSGTITALTALQTCTCSWSSELFWPAELDLKTLRLHISRMNFQAGS